MAAAADLDARRLEGRHQLLEAQPSTPPSRLEAFTSKPSNAISYSHPR